MNCQRDAAGDMARYLSPARQAPVSWHTSVGERQNSLAKCDAAGNMISLNIYGDFDDEHHRISMISQLAWRRANLSRKLHFDTGGAMARLNSSTGENDVPQTISTVMLSAKWRQGRR